PRVQRARGQGRDERAVACGFLAAWQIEGVLETRPQHAPEFGCTLMDRPYLASSNQRGLPGRTFGLVFQKKTQKRFIHGHTRPDTHHEIILSAWRHARVHKKANRPDNPNVETFEFRTRSTFFHDVEKGLDLGNGVVE